MALGRRVLFTVVVAGVKCVGVRCFTLGLRQAGGGNRAVGEAVGPVDGVAVPRLNATFIFLTG